MGRGMLRGVYTERSECAQHDRAGTDTDAWINVLLSIIAPSCAGTLTHLPQKDKKNVPRMPLSCLAW
jgi:hypothetical protein